MTIKQLCFFHVSAPAKVGRSCCNRHNVFAFYIFLHGNSCVFLSVRVQAYGKIAGSVTLVFRQSSLLTGVTT